MSLLETVNWNNKHYYGSNWLFLCLFSNSLFLIIIKQLLLKCLLYITFKFNMKWKCEMVYRFLILLINLKRKCFLMIIWNSELRSVIHYYNCFSVNIIILMEKKYFKPASESKLFKERFISFGHFFLFFKGKKFGSFINFGCSLLVCYPEKSWVSRII